MSRYEIPYSILKQGAIKFKFSNVILSCPLALFTGINYIK